MYIIIKDIKNLEGKRTYWENIFKGLEAKK
jgi:hypothetical protein